MDFRGEYIDFSEAERAAAGLPFRFMRAHHVDLSSLMDIQDQRATACDLAQETLYTSERRYIAGEKSRMEHELVKKRTEYRLVKNIIRRLVDESPYHQAQADAIAAAHAQKLLDSLQT